jgi:uncharacterized membrane protein
MNKKIVNSSQICEICGKPCRPADQVPVEFIREPVAQLIREAHPEWSGKGLVCRQDLNIYRDKYVRRMLETEKGELTTLEEQVMQSLKAHELISDNLNVDFQKRLTLGERIADKIASFGGSWKFIIIFMSMLVIWIFINSLLLLKRPFDPYPFILLNLILSCLAAIQAPVIMMSQNRQEAKDRLRSEYDYRINLKAELEIRHLHEKLDHLITHQWQRLLEIQQIQMDLMEEISAKPKPTK